MLYDPRRARRRLCSAAPHVRAGNLIARHGHSRVESVTKAAAVAESSTGFALGGFQAKLFPSSAQRGEGA